MAALQSRLRAWVVYGIWSLAACAVVVLWLVWSVRSRYPHGFDHCCDKAIGLALLNYAELHGGKFPTGGATPEASLSMLYPELASAYELRGKTYPEEPARRLLEAGKPLTPETCGWHYVDGLSLVGGSTRIAIVWDKVGSGHNAEYLASGGHSVVFMDGHSRVISEADWSRFIADQEIAWAAIRRGEGLVDAPWVPEEFPAY